MSETIVRVAERVAPLAPRSHRRATQLDRLRVAELARRIDQGDDELSAGWAVLADPKLGIARWRGAPASARPSEVVLARKVAALLHRAVPEVVERARELSLARVTGITDQAVQALEEVTSGDFEDPAKARVQLDAARSVLEAVGVGGSRSPGTAPVQIHIDARREINAFRDLIVQDPEAREHARALGIAMARFAGRDSVVADSESG